MFADVLINKKISSLDHSFKYEIPTHLIGNISVGNAVVVPFGKTTTEGFVLAISDTRGDYDGDIKYIKDVLNENFVFPVDLIELASYLGEYYMTPTVAYLRGMLPRGINPFGKIKNAKTEIVYKLTENPLAVSVRLRQQEIVDYLRDHKEVSRKTALNELGFSLSSLNTLEKNGVISRDIREVSRYSYKSIAVEKSTRHEPTAEQRFVLENFHKYNDQHKPFLLRGVTGSGKTEVYLHLVEECMAQGKQSIILLPEIALTPQFIRIFESRFSGEIVVMHSRLSDGERRDSWYAARDGSAKVILGARSAVFAPCSDLGLIIVDEEHEESYEQNTAPRFHTRVVAEERCRQTGASLLFGSATPRAVSYEKGVNGEYILLEMDSRVGNASLPEVEIVDMRRELKAGWTDILSRPLVSAITKNLKRKKQTMLYLNRLGSNTFVSCRDCGFVYQCPNCGISLVYHKKDDALRCHRCNYEERHDGTCPQCKGKRIRYFGLGTEGLEAAVRKRFPDAVIDRLDSDSTRLKGQFDTIYNRVNKGVTDILVGTSMIAKGWDFPSVTLTGIIAADLTLNLPDFHGGERTFQTITQVAGRAGRGTEQGKVILQTYCPDDKIIRFGANQDYRGFFAYEMKKRREFGYPPFAELIRISFTASRDFPFMFNLTKVALVLREEGGGALRVFGPAPAVYRFAGNEEKWQLTILGDDLSLMRSALKRGFSRIKVEKILDKDVKTTIEINPQTIG